MKLLITHPYCRPYVRRGTERVLDELSESLAQRGHQVTVLTSKPGAFEDQTSRGVRAIRFGQPSVWPLSHPAALELLFALRCFFFLLKNRFDLVHCLHYTDACGARLATWFGGSPYIYHMMGIPMRRVYLRRPLDFLLLRAAMHGAQQTLLVSRYCAEVLKRDFGIQGEVVEPPCDLERFHLNRPRDLQEPLFLAVGAFSEPRKGLRVLLRGFELVKERLPQARLAISGQAPAKPEDFLKDLPANVQSAVLFLGTGKPEDLPELYRQAAVTVLPSMWDSLGLVLVESLACGTPVVGTNHGGIPEVIQKGTGLLFEPGSTRSEAVNHEGLAEAMVQALELHLDPDLSDRCRSAAMRFSRDRYLHQIEALHADRETSTARPSPVKAL